jgi:hypothetical protein
VGREDPRRDQDGLAGARKADPAGGGGKEHPGIVRRRSVDLLVLKVDGGWKERQGEAGPSETEAHPGILTQQP